VRGESRRGAPLSSPGKSETEAWNRALATERAAGYRYAIVGPRVTAAEQRLVRSFEAQHGALAAAAEDRLIAARLSPPPAATDYPVPFAVNDVVSARRLALRIESDAASAWRYLVAVTTPGTPGRALAQSALIASAVRAVHWRAALTPNTPTVPFPGLS
jgi:Domain of unknown function (DUF4439)